MGLKDDLKIDLLDLAADAARQPLLYYEWAERYAKAHSQKVAVRERVRVERIRLKQKVDEQRAKLEREVRENWENYSPEKKTEAGVAATVATHPQLAEIQNKYLEALEELDGELAAATETDLLLEAAKDAMAQRKSSIQTAADLYLGGYFSEVKPTKQAKEEATQKTQSQIRGKLKKRTGE